MAPPAPLPAADRAGADRVDRDQEGEEEMIDVATYVMQGDEVLHELTTQWGEQYGKRSDPGGRKRDMVSTLKFYLDAPRANRIVFKLPEGCREVNPSLYEGWVTMLFEPDSWRAYYPGLCEGWVPA